MRYAPPITLRFVFHGFRAVSVSLLLMVTAWIALVPASAVERRALGAQIGVERPEGLVTMRMARAMVHFAPERAARMLSRTSNGEVSVELAGQILRTLADGTLAPIEQITAPESHSSTSPRQVGDAKFIRVD
jgi:hypothetical protein